MSCIDSATTVLVLLFRRKVVLPQPQFDAPLDRIGFGFRRWGNRERESLQALQKWQEWQEHPNPPKQEGVMVIATRLAQLGLNVFALLDILITECRCSP